MSCDRFGLTGDGGTNGFSSSITLFYKIFCIALYQVKAAVHQTMIYSKLILCSQVFGSWSNVVVVSTLSDVTSYLRLNSF